MNFGEQDADVLGVVPGERFWHGEILNAGLGLLLLG
jgi:hypothetical protein